MVVEFLRKRGCVEYTGFEPRIPAMNVTVHDPITREKTQLLAAVDTGFAGHLLLRKQVYEQFASAELPTESFTVYSTMAGPVVLRKARVTIEIGDVTLEAYIETPQYGPGRDIIGRRLLHPLDLALLGPTENCCLLQKHDP